MRVINMKMMQNTYGVDPSKTTINGLSRVSESLLYFLSRICLDLELRFDQMFVQVSPTLHSTQFLASSDRVLGCPFLDVKQLTLAQTPKQLANPSLNTLGDRSSQLLA